MRPFHLDDQESDTSAYRHGTDIDRPSLRSTDSVSSVIPTEVASGISELTSIWTYYPFTEMVTGRSQAAPMSLRLTGRRPSTPTFV
jgi:hypothetical protein